MKSKKSMALILSCAMISQSMAYVQADVPDARTGSVSIEASATDGIQRDQAQVYLDAYTEGDYSYTISNGKAVITGYTGTSTDITIPAKIAGYEVQKIKYNAFAGNKTLTSVVVSEGITSIEYGAFANCLGLMSVSLPSTLVTLGSASVYSATGVFEGCKQLSKVTLAEGSSVASIGYGTFKNCINLVSIEIPKNYQMIYPYAFQACEALKTVVWKDSDTGMIKKIQNHAFLDCKKLTTFSLPVGLSYIGEYAFQNCNSLLSVSVVEGVTEIGEGAYMGCKSLRSVSLPSTLETLGVSTNGYLNYDGVFENCQSLNSVELKKGTKDCAMGINTFLNCSSLQKIEIPGNYVRIGYKSFAGCTSLEMVTYGKNDVTKTGQTIEDYVFQACKALKSVSFSEGLASIGQGAFYQCTSLDNIVLPSTVTAIGYSGNSSIQYHEGAFEGCTNLKNVTIKAGTANAYIGIRTFKNTGITKVIVPGNYKKLYPDAFSNCTSLTEMEYKESGLNYADQIIYSGVFENCTKLAKISLPSSLVEINLRAFANTAVENVVVQEGTERVYDGAFYNCKSLKSVTLPSTLRLLSYTTTNYEGAFESCISLTDVTWKEGDVDATLGCKAFKNCTALESIVIPGNVEIILDYAFQGCTALKSATYRKGLYGYANQTVGYKAFQDCTALEKLCLMETVSTINNTATDNCSSVTIYGQTGSVAETYANNKGYDFKEYVAEDLKITASADKSSLLTGDKVIITANATGGDEEYTYSYLIHNKDTNQWSRLIPSFIEDNTYTWTAGSAGNREFFVEVKDGTGKVVRSGAVNLSVANANPLAINAKGSASSVTKGSKVTITGSASGGKGGYTYSYLVHNKDTNAWSRLTSSFTTSNTYTWTAGSVGNREFFVEVKDSTGKVVRSKAVNVSVTDEKPLAISAKGSASSVTKGSKVTITGTASGGKGGYTYSYLVHNKDTNAWSRLTSSFTTNNTYTWTAGSAGNREFFVEVKDSTGKVVRSSAVNISVKAAASNMTVVAGASVSQTSVGNSVVIFGSASGGSGNYTYSYLVHNKDTNAWSRLTSSFIGNNTYTWKAGSKGNREFFVEAKDSTGKVVRSSAVNIVVK